jgi:hypothetical protein
MTITISFLLGIIGLMFSVKAKQIFEKGLCEADSYRMVMEFNKSKRMRKYSTYFLITSMVLFIFYFIQLLMEKNSI